MLSRRTVVTATGLAAAGVMAVSLAPVAGLADTFISAPDVVVYCDPGLARPLGDVGGDFRARTGVPVRVLAAPGTLLLALLARGTRNDVLVTLTSLLDQAAPPGLIRAGTRAGLWSDPVVLAARDVVPSERPADATLLRGLLGDGRLAVIDPVAADRMDGPATLDRLGWSGVAAGRVDGLPSGQEVAFALAGGADRVGLLHRSDLAGHRGLSVVGVPAPAAAPPARYGAAIGRNALSRNTVAFMAYLTGPEATARLRGAGLEAMA